MSGWHTHTGLAIALPLNNIDTDQIIPARFMSQPRADGYEEFLFHDLRLNTDEQTNPDFPLNRHPQGSVLIAGDNFGSGSSREAAVYALVDAGIRVVIAPGFADIFAGNAVNNGLLPATVSEACLASMYETVKENAVSVTIDIAAKSISIDNRTFTFTLDSGSAEKLINGWDDIDLTLNQATAIDKFSNQHYTENQWALPGSGADRTDTHGHG